ncbi:hypothetical protein BC835DRAFT_1423154 [Cytidiella melzeri]|nr:hypothetical protein BC835DRAFT_1423154 [Cytidiella melzeri]
MRVLTSLVLFTAIVTGTLHTVTPVSASPYRSRRSCSPTSSGIGGSESRSMTDISNLHDAVNLTKRGDSLPSAEEPLHMQGKSHERITLQNLDIIRELLVQNNAKYVQLTLRVDREMGGNPHYIPTPNAIDAISKEIGVTHEQVWAAVNFAAFGMHQFPDEGTEHNLKPTGRNLFGLPTEDSSQGL